MKTITFATTQMNLINCVEYLSTIKGEHALFLMADSPVRYKQIKTLLKNPAYSTVFNKIYSCPKTKNRIVDFILFFVYIARLHLLSHFKCFNVVVTGNYKNYGARLLYSYQSKKNRNCKLIVCDDGLATIAIAKSRITELHNGMPYIFYPNHIIKLFHEKTHKSLIPKKVTFFSTYSFDIVNQDARVKNNYQFIRENLSCFNIDKKIFNCQAILLGQPIYCNGYTSSDLYKQKLLRYFDTVNEKTVYYAHPEETEKQWKEFGLMEQYQYVNNFLPFEIIAAILPPGCRVASFFSSVLMNLHMMNDTLIPECITFKKEQLQDQSNFSTLEECYKCYKKENVTFYEFN